MRFLERVGFVAFNQGARDGLNRGAGFNGRGTGDIGNQRLAEFLRVAQIRVGLDEWLLFHGQIIAENPYQRAIVANIPRTCEPSFWHFDAVTEHLHQPQSGGVAMNP